MLVLTLRRSEKIMIGDSIEIMVVDIREGRIRLGISAPGTVPVLREKVAQEMQAERNSGSELGTEGGDQRDVDSAVGSDKVPPVAPGATSTTE